MSVAPPSTYVVSTVGSLWDGNQSDAGSWMRFFRCLRQAMSTFGS